MTTNTRTFRLIRGEGFWEGRTPMPPADDVPRNRQYKCRKCGEVKKGHKCKGIMPKHQSRFVEIVEKFSILRCQPEIKSMIDSWIMNHGFFKKALHTFKKSVSQNVPKMGVKGGCNPPGMASSSDELDNLEEWFEDDTSAEDIFTNASSGCHLCGDKTVVMTGNVDNFKRYCMGCFTGSNFKQDRGTKYIIY